MRHFLLRSEWAQSISFNDVPFDTRGDACLQFAHLFYSPATYLSETCRDQHICAKADLFANRQGCYFHSLAALGE